MTKIITTTGTITLDELIEKSDIIRPNSIKPKNNVLGDWVAIFEPLAQEIRKKAESK